MIAEDRSTTPTQILADSLPRCRFCRAPLRDSFVDLGMSPLCESFLRADQLDEPELYYPLHVRICRACFLAQLEAYVPAEQIFTEYAYFSSFSDSWVAHARRYTEQARERLGLGSGSFVVELASNDGYLLQHFVRAGIPVLGVEPAANVARAAEERGVPTMVAFFGEKLARQLVAEHGTADLVVGNNVLAQVPDLNDFVRGIKLLLAPGGVATLEFPHLSRLVAGNQLDTIYHEHFSYFSLYTSERIFRAHGLSVFDVEELATHGGSLRLWIRHAERVGLADGEVLAALRERELAEGVDGLDFYASFSERVIETRHRLLEALIAERRAGRQVAGYGAPGKGNTLLNYCGIRQDLLAYTVDRNPYKQGLFLPGTHIPIFHPDRIAQTRPDTILILPWNLRDEIAAQLAYTREWGARLLVPIPRVEVVEAA